MTRITRRSAVALLAAASAGRTLAQGAYPNRTVRWIIPYAAGGGSDAIARTIQPALQRELGQPVVIENKPGAASAIAAAEVARSAPDGYTIFSADNGTLVYNPALFKKLSYDPKEFAPVSLLARAPTILVAGPATQAKDVKELIAQIKAENGKFAYASAGTGSPHAMAMEMFKSQTGVNMIHVPYRGGALSLADVAAGQVPITMSDYSGGGGMIRGGKVRPLAVADSRRIPQLPDVPTFAELGYPGVLAEAFAGIVVPVRTPPEVIARLQAAVQAAVRDPQVNAKLVEIGQQPVGGTPQQFTAVLQQEIPRWHKLIKELNISLD
ncbi:MAG TPA: tripartite tricarboxylate transporter substrate binding protein [Ramlibacter sp.]|nr:tripartite tricarboxylate transporter substrate binding protein [Ramlibacter sp.]